MRLKVILACGVSALSLVAVGCSEEKTYCDGLNESNMPGAIVLVERMDSATRYELAADDERVSLPDDRDSLISCRDIDGLGRVSFPARIEIDDVVTIWESDASYRSPTAYCLSMYFWGVEVTESTGFGLGYWDESIRSAGSTWGDQRFVTETSLETDIDVYSEGTTVGPFELSEGKPIFFTSLLSRDADRFQQTGRIRPEDLVFYEETEDGAPPLIVGRTYTFTRGSDVPDGLAEYLGVPELQNEGFQCVDLFFGYYEEGE